MSIKHSKLLIISIGVALFVLCFFIIISNIFGVFAEENALIFYASWQSDQSIKRSIQNAYIGKNILTLDIVGEVPESKVHDGKIEVNTDAIFLTTVIKVNQTDIVDMNSHRNLKFRKKPSRPFQGNI